MLLTAEFGPGDDAKHMFCVILIQQRIAAEQGESKNGKTRCPAFDLIDTTPVCRNCVQLASMSSASTLSRPVSQRVEHGGGQGWPEATAAGGARRP